MKRVFLGWKSGPLDSAARYLCEEFAQDGLVDLTRHTIVLPTSRAGRRLREILIAFAEQRRLAFFPPQITTVGSLPELLYAGKLPFATPLLQQLAWAKALKTTRHNTLKRVLTQYPETPDDPRWMELGGLLQRQHVELAEHRLDFAAVAEQGTQIEGFSDAERWQALATIQRTYLDVLHELQLWDRQTARNHAVDHGECHFEGHLILLGTVDLSETMRAMLRQLQCEVTSLVVSDANQARAFDEFGCVVPDAWQSQPLHVEEHQILVAEGPANQADAVVLAMDRLDGQYAADEITIGVPDPSLVPYLESRLKQFRIHTRWGAGRSLLASSPFQWLRLVAEYLGDFRYESFAELLRHPDTQRYLSGLQYPANSVKELDRYFDKHLPDSLHADRPYAGELPRAVELICELLAPLTSGGGKHGSAKQKASKQPSSKQASAKKSAGVPQHGPRLRPAEWGTLIHEVLMRLYERRQLNVDSQQDRSTLLACEQIAHSIERFAGLPDTLAPEMAAATAILMVLSQVEVDEVPPPAGEQVIEMVGWLDLPLDDAKVAIVTSMNDGVVPKSVSSDVFLPNTFRQVLGLDDNARRYARDAYAVQVLLQSKMAVRFIVGRRTATNDPLRPSRLLMACHRDKLAPRCIRLFEGKPDCDPIVLPVERDTMAFSVPQPQPQTEPLESISVSDFARYLDCPYRFYLTKIQRLRTIDDRTREINATTFGDIAHAVLEDFGESEFKESSDEDEIRAYLSQHLSRIARARFGANPKPTVQVQIARLQVRLSAFATQQARWREQGWTIMQTELVEDHGELVVDGEPMRLRGRIDRIDRRTTDVGTEYAILDYKTGDRGSSPDEKHLKKRDGRFHDHWVDLQLPLYMHLLQSLPEMKHQPTRLGYILLPSDSKYTQFSLVEWGLEELQTATEVAHEIVRRIRREEFWPPTDPYPYPSSDDYATILQHGVFGRESFAVEASA